MRGARTTRVLVTGATGFLGSALVELLGSQRYPEFDAVSWPRTDDSDLLSVEGRRRMLSQLRPDVVVHLAWRSTGVRDYESDSLNHEWAEHSMQFSTECTALGVRFLCAGSASDDVREPMASHINRSVYASSKRALRRHVLSSELPQYLVTWLNIHYVFSIEHLRPRLLRQMMDSETPREFVALTPQARHDFVHLNDVAESICIALRREVNGAVTIGSGFTTSVESFLETAKFHLLLKASRPVVTDICLNGHPTTLESLGWLPEFTYKFFGVTKEGLS